MQTLRRALTRWTLHRRLKTLQKQYYAAPDREDVIKQYLEVLREARGQGLAEPAHSGNRKRKIHLGSGEHRLEGWINVDWRLLETVDVITDFSSGLPWRDESIDLIHSEDLIEHLDLEVGRELLQECFRVLRGGGVMRILTPDLRKIVKQVYLRRSPSHLTWCGLRLNAPSPCEALNAHLRMEGDHRFIYDFSFLAGLLRQIGFSVRRSRYNASRQPELRYLDLRDFGLNLFIEAEKPVRADVP